MTEEEFLEWKSHPATQDVFTLLKNRRNNIMDRIVNLATANAAEFAHKAAVSSGVIIGINELLELTLDDFLYKENY